VVVAVIATVVLIAAVQDRSKVVMVPVASRTIPAGAPVDGSSVTLQRLPASSALRAGIVSASSLTGGGWVATTSIHAGDPITTSEVQRSTGSTAGMGSMSLTVPADHANGGNLVTGDRVDVIAATGGQAQYVARGLQVLSVAPNTSKSVGLGSGSASSNYYIVVAVDPGRALALTAALQGGSQGVVEVVRTTGLANDTNDNPVASPVPLIPTTQPSTQTTTRVGG